MNDAAQPIEEMRAIGLFERPRTLPELLQAVGEFFVTHQIDDPLSFRHEEHPELGWHANIELKLEDYLRVLENYPMPHRMEFTSGHVVLHTELRAATLCAKAAAPDLSCTIREGQLVIHPAAPAMTDNLGDRVTRITRIRIGQMR